MYRDADEILRQRFEAVLERANDQLEGLTPEDLEELPEELRRKLAEFDSDFAPEVLSPAALIVAERALDARAPLAREARSILKRQRRAARRRRRDRALERGLEQRRRRRVIVTGLASLVFLVPAYLVVKAQTKEKCRAAAVCELRGDCSVNAFLDCQAGSDADCRQSEYCKHYGWCSLVDGSCETRGPEDCRYMDQCQPPAECRFEDGDCVTVSRSFTSPDW